MLIRPMPLPDELDRGYLGRIGRINGLRDEKQCVALMASWAGLAGRSGKEVPRVELLRQVAGMTIEAFVCLHTTLPLRRGITSYRANLCHGDASSRSILWTSAIRTARPGAYFCPECVVADQDFHGVSYWRREHQIPGVIVCGKHRAPLSYADGEISFYEAPAAFFGNCHTIPNEWAIQTIENPAVRRYLDICAGLLEQPKPFDVRHVSQKLAERARRRGLQTQAKPGKRKSPAPLLSDLVVDTFGAWWLGSVFPDLINNPRGKILNRMDGVLYLTTSASTVVAYVLAASVLFDSADAALGAFREKPDGASSRVRARALGSIEDELLRSAYFAAHGGHAATARSLNSSVTAVGSRLDAMGLPNLRTRGKVDPIAALRALLVEGRSFEDSAARGKLSLPELESYVLRAAGHLLELLVPDRPAGGPAKRRANRTRQFAPHEVSRMNFAETAEGT